MKRVIRHKALIKAVDGDKMTITIPNQTACEGCHANETCLVAGSQEKEIEVSVGDSIYSTGQEVTLLFHESDGFKAMFYGYLLPFILVFVTLLAFFFKTNNEVLSGLLSIGILIPYYTTLYIFRHNLKKVFKFEVEKIDMV